MSLHQPRHADGKFAGFQHAEQSAALPGGRWSHLTEPAAEVLGSINDLDMRPGAAAVAAEHESPLVRWHGLDQGYDLPTETRARLVQDPGVRWIQRLMRGGRIEPYPA